MRWSSNGDCMSSISYPSAVRSRNWHSWKNCRLFPCNATQCNRFDFSCAWNLPKAPKQQNKWTGSWLIWSDQKSPVPAIFCRGICSWTWKASVHCTWTGGLARVTLLPVSELVLWLIFTPRHFKDWVFTSIIWKLGKSAVVEHEVLYSSSRMLP